MNDRTFKILYVTFFACLVGTIVLDLIIKILS